MSSICGHLDSLARGAVDWATVELPDAWPDVTLRNGARSVLEVIGAVLREPRVVELPAGLPGAEHLPAYLLREFHHLPNGFYSKRIAAGYSRGFEVSMLGHMRRVRARIAGALVTCAEVADIGAGSGKLAEALAAAGAHQVWAVEPSPYLLQVAARRLRGVRVVQGLAERTGFADEQLDGVGLTYVWHELPAPAAERALIEIRRILRPGGWLAFAEPSPGHYGGTLCSVVRRGGLRALYFHVIARLAYEPYVQQWHERDVSAWLTGAGFRIVEFEDSIPTRIIVAERL